MNILFLIIYILGIITTLCILYRNLKSGEKVILFELLLGIVFSLCSWFAFIVVILVLYGDITVFKKK